MKTPTGEDGYSPSRAQVTTRVKEILDYNPNRLWAVVTNNSSTTAYIGLSEGVTTTSGTQLTQNDLFTIDLTNPYTGPVYAITASGTADLRIMQVGKCKGHEWPEVVKTRGR